MLALLAFQRRQPAAPVRILCRHTICSLWVATPQPPSGYCISLYRSDYLLTLSRPSHFHPLGCTLLRSGFPRRFDSRYTFKNVLLFLSSITFKLRTVLPCIDLQGFHRFHEVYTAGQWRILPSFRLSSMA